MMSEIPLVIHVSKPFICESCWRKFWMNPADEEAYQRKAEARFGEDLRLHPERYMRVCPGCAAKRNRTPFRPASPLVQ
jgi:hypothetical protein